MTPGGRPCAFSENACLLLAEMWLASSPAYCRPWKRLTRTSPPMLCSLKRGRCQSLPLALPGSSSPSIPRTSVRLPRLLCVFVVLVDCLDTIIFTAACPLFLWYRPPVLDGMSERARPAGVIPLGALFSNPSFNEGTFVLFRFILSCFRLAFYILLFTCILPSYFRHLGKL